MSLEKSFALVGTLKTLSRFRLSPAPLPSPRQYSRDQEDFSFCTLFFLSILFPSLFSSLSDEASLVCVCVGPWVRAEVCRVSVPLRLH